MTSRGSKTATSAQIISAQVNTTLPALSPNFFSVSLHSFRQRLDSHFPAEQFSKYANLFFLFTACIQPDPGVSPTSHYTTIVPLGVVLLASAFKESQEDLKRHQSDRELNARTSKVLRGDGTFEARKWKNIRDGELIRLDFIPANLVLISSSEPEGLCYIETSNLDGETNLEIKQASLLTSNVAAPHPVNLLRESLQCDAR